MERNGVRENALLVLGAAPVKETEKSCEWSLKKVDWNSNEVFFLWLKRCPIQILSDLKAESVTLWSAVKKSWVRILLLGIFKWVNASCARDYVRMPPTTYVVSCRLLKTEATGQNYFEVAWLITSGSHRLRFSIKNYCGVGWAVVVAQRFSAPAWWS